MIISTDKLIITMKTQISIRNKLVACEILVIQRHARYTSFINNSKY